MGDELGAGVDDLDVADMARLPLDGLARLGDTPLAHSLRRRWRELEHPDITVAVHDSNAS